MDYRDAEAWRILLVDDDEDDYIIALTTLSQAPQRKINLEWAANPSAARRMLQTTQYDAVLVDYDLGDSTGIELIREISPNYPAPLILYTGRGSYEVDMVAMQAGATAYITKGEFNTLLLERSIRYAIERKQSEQALSESEEKYRTLAEYNFDWEYWLSPDAQLIYMSSSCEAISGYPAADFINDPELMVRIAHPEDQERLRRHMLEELSKNEFEQFEFRILTPDGQERRIRHRCVAVYDRNGKWRGRRASNQDITATWRVEQALQESEKLARNRLDEIVSLYQNSPVGMCVLDTDLRFLRINAKLAQINGLPVEAHLGRTVREVLPELADVVEPEMRRVLETGEPRFAMEVTAQVPAEPGVTHTWNESWLPIHDPDGRITGLNIVVLDTTGYTQSVQAAAAVNARLENILNCITEGYYALDSEWRFKAANRIAEQHFGKTGAELIGQNIWEMTGVPSESNLFAHFTQAAQTRQPVHFEAQSRVHPGYWAELHIYPTDDNLLEVYFSDISARKQAEARLEAYTERLRCSNESLEDFAFIASHDLREPLHKVQTFSELLQARYSSALDENGREYIQRMEQAVGRMQSMLDGLLAYSRVTTQGRPYTLIDLNTVVAEVIADLDYRIQRTRGRVEVEPLPAIEADAVQMNQLLQNLIGNALKFHRPEVPPVVHVSSRPVQSGGPAIEISVADNGIGFQVDDCAGRIFQPFSRMHGRSQFEGSGMGLSICRKIVERHGGEITVESTPNAGTTFRIRLPVRRDVAGLGETDTAEVDLT